MKTITHEIRMNISINIPDGHTEESLLREQAYANLDQRKMFWRNEDSGYYTKLEEELAAVSESGHAGYLLVIASLAEQNRRAGIPVSPVGNLQKIPLLAFAFGLSEEDPIRFEI